jgi:hypothetical protein
MKKTMKKLSPAKAPTVKMVLVIGTLLLSAVAFAKTKVTDFNDIIEENNKAQKIMHNQIQQNLDETQQIIADLKAKHVETMVAEGETINVPTDKNLLKFAKEKQHYQPSKEVNDKRLAQEIDDMQ